MLGWRQFTLLVAATIVVFATAPFLRVKDERQYRRDYGHRYE